MMVEQNRQTLGILLAAALLLALGVLLQFYRLHDPELHLDAPARIAAHARDMNAEGLWLAPVEQGRPQLDVSPLHLWSVKLAARLTDDVQPAHVRFPGALGGLLLALLGAWWFYNHAQRYGREDMVDAPAEGFALLAGLIILTNPLIVAASRSGTPAMIYAVLALGAAFCWGESLEARRSFYAGRPWRVWLLWGYVLAGLSTLIYGPLALLLPLVPYMLAARSYRLRRVDWIHLPGMALALALGGWWPLAVGLAWPDAASEAWGAWLALALPMVGQPERYTLPGLAVMVLASLPWLALALVMAGRVWSRKDRSPTLVYWMMLLVTGGLLLTLASPWTGLLVSPLAVLVALLATDALFRWNFETRAAEIFRSVLRVAIILALAVGIFLAILTESDLGLALLALIAISWVVWTVRASRHGIIYTQFETTSRLATMSLLLFIAAVASFLGDWLQRENLIRPTVHYFRRAEQLAAIHRAPTYYLGEDVPGLYRYYFGADQGMAPEPDVEALRRRLDEPAILFARGDQSRLAEHPGLVQLTVNPQGTDFEHPADVMYLVRPVGASPPYVAPMRVALLGNTGTRTQSARSVGHEMDRRAAELPIHHAILLGNNIHGPTVFNHLDFIESFENTFRRPLARGTVFHAALGHEDQSYAFLQTRYPPFNMGGQRYYRATLGDGLIDCFILDSEPMRDDAAAMEEQLSWLEAELVASRATWRLVGLHAPLLTAAGRGRVSEPLAESLLPLLRRHRVDVVSWGGNPWYERLRPREDDPIFFNTGWSGRVEEAKFADAPMLEAGYDARTGFILLEATADRLEFRAINRDGEEIDAGALTRGGSVTTGP